MFPLQPKVCLFIQIQRSSNKAFKIKENSIQSNKSQQTALKKTTQFIYVQSKKKRKEKKKNLPTPEYL